MPYVSVGKENSKDIEIYYKDWGSGQPRRLQPWLAAQRRRVGRSDVLSAIAWLSLHRP